MAAPAHRNSNSSTHNISSSWSHANPPSSTAEGDILLAFIVIDRNTVAITGAPSGWTGHPSNPIDSRTGDSRGYLYWKRAGASEAGPYAWTLGDATGSGGIGMGAYSGCIASGDPHDDWALNASTSDGTSHTSATITTDDVDRLVVFFIGMDLSATSTPQYSSWTNSANERLDFENATYYVEIGSADYVKATAGTTSCTVTSAVSDQDVMAIVALLPAAGTPEERTYKRLYGPAQLTGSAADLYTCPASTVTRILGIHASNPSGSPVDINLSIGADAAATRIFEDYAVPADGIVRESYPYELAAGEKLQGWADSAGTVVLTITGYEDPV